MAAMFETRQRLQQLKERKTFQTVLEIKLTEQILTVQIINKHALAQKWLASRSGSYVMN